VVDNAQNEKQKSNEPSKKDIKQQEVKQSVQKPN